MDRLLYGDMSDACCAEYRWCCSPSEHLAKRWTCYIVVLGARSRIGAANLVRRDFVEVIKNSERSILTYGQQVLCALFAQRRTFSWC
jgi:hypothetical protein